MNWNTDVTLEDLLRVAEGVADDLINTGRSEHVVAAKVITALIARVRQLEKYASDLEVQLQTCTQCLEGT